MDINKPEINAFINDYVKDLRSGHASIFVGAGISRGAGYVDWKGLLTNNWNLINHAKEENIHFNVRKLESVIGYDKNDKSSLGIWELLKSDQFDVSENLFPEKLMKFIGLS